MVKCSSCDQESRTRLDANNLCKKCAEAAKTSEKEFIGVDPDKSIAELTVRELVEIIKKVTDPIEARITKIDGVVEPLVKQVKILEKELREKTEKIDTLTSIIINMQKSLNMIDMGERSCNVMISGLNENELIVENDGNEQTLTDDKGKVQHIMKVIGVNIPNADILECIRIGKEKEDFTRMLKVKVKSKEQRAEITDKAPNLKAIPYLKKIYVKKDTHPVYVQETGRLRTKMKKLKEIPGNEDRVKIVNGNLEVDGKVIDRNTFFV